MKTIKSVVLLIACVLSANFVPGESPGSGIAPLDNAKKLVAVADEEPGGFVISVLNGRDEVVYNKLVSPKTINYSSVYDLSKLEPGAYKPKMESKGGVVERGLTIARL